MCLVVVSWKADRQFPLIVAANRDERFDRPAAPVHWWDDHPNILAGRDLTAGGTWLGVSRNGRFGIITNFRDAEPPTALRSRGELITQWLTGEQPAAAFHAALENSETAYAGYNLLFGDQHELHYFSNRSTSSGALKQGLYALSNATLDTPWPKVTGARDHMRRVIKQQTLAPEHFMPFLRDKKPAPDKLLPQASLPIEQRRVLSAPFIVGEQYGTRCSTVMSIGTNGQVQMHEQRYAPLGEPTDSSEVEFTII